jgi:hypothetical protein
VRSLPLFLATNRVVQLVLGIFVIMSPAYHKSTFSINQNIIEIVGLEGESTNEKWTIFLGYQGKFIMVLTSAVRLGCLLEKKIFCNSIKQVSIVFSADVSTIIFWPS